MTAGRLILAVLAVLMTVFIAVAAYRLGYQAGTWQR